MPSSLPAIRSDDESGLALWHESLHHAQHYAAAARAPSTRRAYAADWKAFQVWCSERDINALPADPRHVALFLSDEAVRGLAPASIGRRLASIGLAHRQAGFLSPQQSEHGGILLEVLAGIRRSWRKLPSRKVAADADILRDLLRATPGNDLKAIRDRAILGFGMAGAFRRSELASLRMEDITRDPRGVRVRFGMSKTDQEGSGTVIAIPEGQRIRPIALLDAWLHASDIQEGFIFRGVVSNKATAMRISDRGIARVVQRAAKAAGYDPARFGGHSLRAGFVTAAARAGASIFRMKDVSRHKSTDVLATYIREEQIFHHHAGDGFL